MEEDSCHRDYFRAWLMSTRAELASLVLLNPLEPLAVMSSYSVERAWNLMSCSGASDYYVFWRQSLIVSVNEENAGVCFK